MNRKERSEQTEEAFRQMGKAVAVGIKGSWRFSFLYVMLGLLWKSSGWKSGYGSKVELMALAALTAAMLITVDYVVELRKQKSG